MRFICDAMLGSLARHLRILGLDTIYVRSTSDVARYRANGETPYFFTKRKFQSIPYGNAVYVESNHVTDQLKEVKKIVLPYVSERDFMRRCIKCNVLLADVNKDEVESLVPEFVFHRYSTFKSCPSCKKVYWEGTHVDRMKEWIGKMREPSGEQDER
jgi:uncharacterized protein with PIN domain